MVTEFLNHFYETHELIKNDKEINDLELQLKYAYRSLENALNKYMTAQKLYIDISEKMDKRALQLIEKQDKKYY